MNSFTNVTKAHKQPQGNINTLIKYAALFMRAPVSTKKMLLIILIVQIIWVSILYNANGRNFNLSIILDKDLGGIVAANAGFLH